MKILFEDTYNFIKVERELSQEQTNELGMLFEYTFLYKELLKEKILTEESAIKKEMYLHRIQDIEKILKNNYDISTALHESRKAL